MGRLSSGESLDGFPFRLGHRPSLDGLRGVAVLLVLLFHARVPGMSGGGVGVDVFFVLSGFLITSLLCQEQQQTGRINLRAFYLRRVLRLYPALAVLILVLGVYVVLFPAGTTGRTFWKESLLALFYLTNWFKAYDLLPPGTVLSHTWSLSVEEQYYLLWPSTLSLLLAWRWRRGWIVALTFGLMIASAGFRAAHWLSHESRSRVNFGLDARADGLLLGSLLALLLSWNLAPSLRRRARRIAWLGGLSVVLLASGAAGIVKEPDWVVAGQFAANASVAAIILALVTAPSSRLVRFFEWPALVYLGRVSYAAYLWNVPVLHAFMKLSWISYGWSAVAITAATLALAVASYFLVERPILKLKRRWTSGEAGGIALSPP